MFDLIAQLNERKRRVESNESAKATVALIAEQLEAAKQEVIPDSEIETLKLEMEQITEYCYALGLIARPVVEEVAPENVENL